MRGKNWTDEEVEYLRENWGYKPVNIIAKNLNRTYNGINVKAKRLKLGSAYSSGEFMTGRQISCLMRVDIHTVTDFWIKKRGLKAKYKSMAAKRKMYLINLDNLVLWLKNNQDKWDNRKVERHALSTEPQWLKEKRQKDSDMPDIRYYKWTAHEDQRAIMLFKHGKKIKEIAESLNRSRSAVEHRLARLDVWGTGKFNHPVLKYRE